MEYRCSNDVLKRSEGQFRTITINYKLEVMTWIPPAEYFEFINAPLRGL